VDGWWWNAQFGWSGVGTARVKKKIEYDYRPVPTIERFSECDRFIRGIMGPFGSGKSSGCVMEIITRGMAQRPGADGIRRTRWAVIRNSYPQLNDSTIRTFCDWFPPHIFGKYKAQSHEYLITRFKDCEIEVLFRALDRPDQVENLLSTEYTGAWINEAREIPEAIFEAIQGRVGRFPSSRDEGCTWDGIILDTNPPDTDSWWYRHFEESLDTSRKCTEIVDPETEQKCGEPSVRVFNKFKPEEYASCAKHDKYELFKQPSGLSAKAENLINLKKDYYQNLAAGKKSEFIKVYIKGEYGFIIDGQPVYPEYDDEMHCKEYEVTEGVVIRRGWDFGLTPAVTFSQMHPDGSWRVFDEFIGQNVAADRFSDDLVTYCNQHYPDFWFEDFGDPAGDSRSQVDERTCFQILRAKGINIAPGEQEPGLRIESVKRALNRHNGFWLHPRCVQLRKGFKGGYFYRKLQNKSGTISEKPEKNDYSHPHDALQYDATRLFAYELRTPRKEAERKRYESKKSRPRRSWMAA
jgi:hypothetical protein